MKHTALICPNQIVILLKGPASGLNLTSLITKQIIRQLGVTGRLKCLINSQSSLSEYLPFLKCVSIFQSLFK